MTMMPSANKSKKEEEEKKKKKKKKKTEESSSNTTIKKKPTKQKEKDRNKNENKFLNGVKESPKVSIIASSSSEDSPEQVQKEAETKKELLSEKPKATNRSMNGSESSKTEKKNKRREVKEEADLEEVEDGTLCCFPISRIKRIIKSEDSAAKLPQDVVFLVNKATEMFVEQFCEEAYECSVRDRKKSLAYRHLSSVVSEQRRFDFLSDFVPKQLKAEEALEQRKLAETGPS